MSHSKRHWGLPPAWGASVNVVHDSAGMLRLGDGFGVHLNRKPHWAHLLAMRIAFGWRWVRETKELSDGRR